MDEFGMGSFNLNSAAGPAVNPCQVWRAGGGWAAICGCHTPNPGLKLPGALTRRSRPNAERIKVPKKVEKGRNGGIGGKSKEGNDGKGFARRE